MIAFLIHRGDRNNPLVSVPFLGTIAGVTAEAKRQHAQTKLRTWVTLAREWDQNEDDRRFWDSKWDVRPVAEGAKHFGDGEAWIRWAVFPPTVDDDVAKGHFFAPNGFWDGPGRGFARSASVRRTRTRVLVTQSGGLDI
jgi:hypothetical protein